MTTFQSRGKEIRGYCKSLVLEFMQVNIECKNGNIGMRQSKIFHGCGFDWGNYPKVTSSLQQYWIVAILSELREEGKVEQVSESGPWRLKN